MNGFRFYADLPGTLADDKPLFSRRVTVRQLASAASEGAKCNVIALLLGRDHQCHDGSQECISATFGHADSDTSLCSVGRDYLAKCRRIPEPLARKLHPRLFARLDQS